MARPRTSEQWAKRIEELKAALEQSQAKYQRLESRRGGLAAVAFSGDEEAQRALAELTAEQEQVGRDVEDAKLAVEYAENAYQEAVVREAEKARSEALEALKKLTPKRLAAVQRVDALAEQLATALQEYQDICREQESRARRLNLNDASAYGHKSWAVESAFSYYFRKVAPSLGSIHQKRRLIDWDSIAREAQEQKGDESA